jgi:hypothetical protein
MTDVFPYQRLSLDAGILSHRSRMLIRGDGGKRLMSGDRIRTPLALSVNPVRVRQAEWWQSVSVLPGGTCQWRKMTQL